MSPTRYERRAVRGTVVLTLVTVATAAAQEVPDSVRQAAEAAPLFASHDVLAVTLSAPLRSVFRERGEEAEEYDGTLSYTGGDSTVTLDVKVRTRGHYRLQQNVCGFPPLRLDFPKSKVVGTLFEGQNKLKLVTHCQDGREDYEQNLLEEYLAYRIFNTLTDASFRVRLLRATYVDTEGRRDTLTRYAFLIEDEDMLAARLGYQSLALPGVPPDQVDQRQLWLFEVFQYMIGNTDWSAFTKAPTEEACCHNARLVGFPWGPVFEVPYDFDWSGLVNARYARPDPMVGVRSVRQRRYWGICADEGEVESVFPLFNEKREAIADLVRNQEGLSADNQKDALEYLDEFYEVINDPGKVRGDIIRRCRPVQYR